MSQDFGKIFETISSERFFFTALFSFLERRRVKKKQKNLKDFVFEHKHFQSKLHYLFFLSSNLS